MESDMKPDQERVRNLLTDTVTLLCKNGLTFSDQLRIEGLLGVSIDNSDVFFVHISEKFSTGIEKKQSEPVTEYTNQEAVSEQQSSAEDASQQSPHQQFTAPSSPAPSPRHQARESPCSSPSVPVQASSPLACIESPNVKLEPVEEYDDLVIMDEPNQEVIAKVARQASIVAGRRRVLGGHQRSQSSSGQSQHGEYPDWEGDLGEPPAKRRFSMSESSENGAYVTMHGQDQGWADLSGVGDPVGQSYSGAGGGYDMALPGCSAWAAPSQSQQSQEMMITTASESGARYPTDQLTSRTVRDAIATYINMPVMAQEGSVYSFRLIWSAKDSNEDAVWANMARHREYFDEKLKAIPGVAFFVSAFTATISQQRQRRNVIPCIGYWVVASNTGFHEPSLYINMRQNPFGAVLKLLTGRQGMMTSDRSLQMLCMIMKDYSGYGYVRRKIDSHCSEQPLINVHVTDNCYKDQLVAGRVSLANVGVHVELLEY